MEHFCAKSIKPFLHALKIHGSDSSLYVFCVFVEHRSLVEIWIILHFFILWKVLPLPVIIWFIVCIFGFLKNLLRYNNNYYLKDILRTFPSRSIFVIFFKFTTITDIEILLFFTCSLRLIIIIQYLKHLKATLFCTCKFHMEFNVNLCIFNIF